MRRRLGIGLAALAGTLAITVPAFAAMPYARPGADTTKYTDLYLNPGETPNDLDGDGNTFKFAATSDPSNGPQINSNPFEMFGVRGAHIDDADPSVNTAWMTTTGRPDVSIAVLDSGIKWNDPGAMSDLRLKVRLNPGELPTPRHDLSSAISDPDRTTAPHSPRSTTPTVTGSSTSTTTRATAVSRTCCRQTRAGPGHPECSPPRTWSLRSPTAPMIRSSGVHSGRPGAARSVCAARARQALARVVVDVENPVAVGVVLCCERGAASCPGSEIAVDRSWRRMLRRSTSRSLIAPRCRSHLMPSQGTTIETSGRPVVVIHAVFTLGSASWTPRSPNISNGFELICGPLLGSLVAAKLERVAVAVESLGVSPRVMLVVSAPGRA